MIWSERPPAALAEYTGFLMNWVALRSRRHFAARLHERFGLHPRDFGALNVIERDPGLTQHALGEAAGVDPSTMVAALDGLEDLGLAERRPHPSDRRKRAVYLTDKGREVVREARGLASETGQEILGVLTPEERAELNRLMRKLSGLGDADEAGAGAEEDGADDVVAPPATPEPA